MSFDLDPDPDAVGLAFQAVQLSVCAYDPDEDDPDSAYTTIPNVWCAMIQKSEGMDPPTARFRYVFDDTYASQNGWPNQFEQVWPIDAQGDYVVQPDDRLVVLINNPDGSQAVLWDGFAQVPEVEASGPGQRVEFTGVSVAVRKFDLPIQGRTQRDAANYQTTDGTEDVDVDLPCRFNPSDDRPGSEGGYRGNAVGEDYYTQGNQSLGGDYPVFLDPLMSEVETPTMGVTSLWWVSDAVEYLIGTEEYADGEDSSNPYVTWPAISSIEDLLNAQYIDAQGNLQQSDITIRDYDASNKAMPTVVQELLNYAGFVCTWDISADDDGLPQTKLRIYRRDGYSTSAQKVIYLDSAGQALDPASNNVSSLRLARDINGIMNAWAVETSNRHVEVCVVLAPLFTPSAGDATSPQRDTFRLTAFTPATTAATRRAYRWYGADECGIGHWNFNTSTFVTGTALDLSSVFPPDDDGTPSYVTRFRPGLRQLIAEDSDGHPLHATLEAVFGYTGYDPAVNGTKGENGFNLYPSSNWMAIRHGWQLLPDRLGIMVTVEDPENWGTGNKKIGDIRGITWVASPPEGSSPGGNSGPFLLRLTCVIEDDLRMPISLPKRTASPTKFSRWRSADARDHFQYCTIDPSSPNYAANNGNGTDPVVIRDDTTDATTHGAQLRSAHEFPPLAGTVTIPYWTDYYDVGDLITQIQGRDVSLQTNVGADQGEPPCYAWVVGIAWHFSPDRQETVLTLTDRRAEARNL